MLPALGAAVAVGPVMERFLDAEAVVAWAFGLFVAFARRGSDNMVDHFED